MFVNQILDVKPGQRLFFITDPHGCIDMVDACLAQLGFKVGQDVVVCAGDLIDRGPKNLQTAFRFINDQTGSYYSILGNHDMFPVDMDFDNWIPNGGMWTVDEGLDTEDCRQFGLSMKKLPVTMTVNFNGRRFGIVHGAVPYECATWDALVESLSDPKKQFGIIKSITWCRDFVEYAESPYYQSSMVGGVDLTISGHTPTKEPLMVANRLHIDTGYVRNKRLTVAEVVGGEIFAWSYSGQPDAPKKDLLNVWDITSRQLLHRKRFTDLKP